MADDEAERAFFEAQGQNGYPTGSEMVEERPDSPYSDGYDPMQSLQGQYSAPLASAQMGSASNLPSAPNPDPSISHPLQPSPFPQNFQPTQQSHHTTLAQTLPGIEAESSATPMPPSDFPVHPDPHDMRGHVGLEGAGKEEEEEGEEEEEEEEEGVEAEYEPPAALGHAQDVTSSVSADIPQDSVSQAMNENVSSSDVSQQKMVSDKITPQDVPISSSVPASSHVGISSQPVSVSEYAHNEPHNRAQPTSAEPSERHTPAIPETSPASKGRLPHDRVGILEDRIQADPRGDMEAWLELINEHRSRNKIESAREVYERFFTVFPASADQWVAYANMESENSEFYRMEQIFSKTLLTIPSVQLWIVYLDYVRRRNNLTTDTTGQARRTISSAYDFALKNIGIDKDSGSVWMDYIQFIQSGPGNVGGSGWQDQQKMDSVRKAYQRAICIPTQAVNSLWKDYDQFEMGLNKVTGRKFLQERSPLYMTARSSYTELQNITKDLTRSSLPRLPPAPGFEGHDEYMKQADIWKRWIKWEKDDPLVLKDEDPSAYKARVVYVYKQALMAMRFLPEIWFDAADFCFQNGMETEGNDFLKQGIDANPESCLLAFKRGDRLEITSESEQDSVKRGEKVREAYDKVLDALYELIAKAKAKETEHLALIEEKYAQTEAQPQADTRAIEEEEEEGGDESKAKDAARSSEIEAAKKEHTAQVLVLSKTISFAWIALMRAMRRIQGKGKPNEIAGSRQIFADARKRGRITSDVYIASALLEHHCYKDPAATKIFERGAKLFPDDEVFALEYLKHLIDINDITNARAVFETSVRRLATTPEGTAKSKPIFSFLHEYESRYGDLVQIINLENRMRELFPEDPTLRQFSRRYATPSFDPTAFQPILSSSQVKPKMPVPTIETETSRRESPGPRYLSPPTRSPKRGYPGDNFDDEHNRPRKTVRGASPLKGAAGRRLDHQKRTHHQPEPGLGIPPPSRGPPQPAQPPPLPKEIMFLLSIMPPASTYDSIRFQPDKLANLIRQTEIPQSAGQQRQQAPHQPGARPQYTGGRSYR